MKADGLIGHIGLSNVNADQLRTAMSMTDIAAVTVHYNVAVRLGAAVRKVAEETGIVFSPLHPPPPPHPPPSPPAHPGVRPPPPRGRPVSRGDRPARRRTRRHAATGRARLAASPPPPCAPDPRHHQRPAPP